MECKICERIEGDGDRPVHLYLVDKERGEIHAMCKDCAKSRIGKKLTIPKGWELVPSDALDAIKKGNEAFIKARGVMVDSVPSTSVSSGYIYDLDKFYKRIQSYFENQIKAHLIFKEELGLTFCTSDALVSGAYCPECRSPLLHMAKLRADKSLSIAACSLKDFMGDSREERNGTVLVCLNCQIAYVEKQSKKKD